MSKLLKRKAIGNEAMDGLIKYKRSAADIVSCSWKPTARYGACGLISGQVMTSQTVFHYRRDRQRGS